ncbi:MAG: response regulator transcription factor [Candidatus Dadabacteria bacterium]|nr:response regulator transcription factor [Candidatus Dadabacteria bacterium]NIS07616.1 response regulator transcription factor [Candidatus Dadabacteria bacterium]NIV42070.1 response regulator [Candidatus Dadabacteria bacterium]NIX16475.1 response regulator [Candidatus Dadabacteria bacterium]NIY21254.1 response regulator [Candidatus Dadabacteria bacterium]
MSEKTVVIVDDEQDIVELVSHHLKREGFLVKEFSRGREFFSYLESILPDLIILDIMLPGIDGLEICKILKNKQKTAHIPIIMLTAKAAEADVVVGLELGADDYVVKPFSPRELVARVKSVFRRLDKKESEEDVVKIGPLSVNPDKYEVIVDGKSINLTTTEFKILEVLTERKGSVFSRDQLLKKKRLWGDDKLVYDRTIDVHIKNLREKLGVAGHMIKTIRGVGYKLEAV